MKTIKWFGKACIAGIISITILSIYIYFFSFSGVHIENKTKATDYTWEAFSKKSCTGEGVSWITMDQNGFNNRSFPDSINILLMGSSHMEAVNLASNQNVGVQLNDNLQNLTTYNIGVSGHSIYTCIQNMEAAILTYEPSDYVILETGSIEMNVDDMNMVLDNNYPEIVSYDSGILYILQKKLPIVKSVYKTICDWKSAESRSEVSDTIDKTDYTTQEYKEVLNKFLRKAQSTTESTGAKLIIFYHPQTILDNNGNMIITTDSDALSAFQEACNNNNILFLDMTSDFEKIYYEDHILAHGFINTAVGVGHLNKYGHKIIAERLAEIIGGENNVSE